MWTSSHLLFSLICLSQPVDAGEEEEGMLFCGIL